MSKVEEITLATKSVGEIKGHFNVPSYQRGYRWGTEEVVRLLDDIYKNGKNNYCLQPIVIRRIDPEKEIFELIDGQQRLTTIYLIYKYIASKKKCSNCNNPTFTLDYETREKTAELLKSLGSSEKQKYQNIDFYFICNAYDVIHAWFSDSKDKIKTIEEYLDKSIKVIWYEVSTQEDPISLFTRLNIGKIPLTSSELVKAIFLSSRGIGNLVVDPKEISLEWDNIEKELRDDSFWYFLTNKFRHKYQTRIDLVLDLLAGKKQGCIDKFHTFFYFDNVRKTRTLESIWRDIQQTFLTLKDWYEDHELYHKIGYLIAVEESSLQSLYKKANENTKSDFKIYIDDLIKKTISLNRQNGSRSKTNYSELSYAIASDYRLITRLLLLFNIESVRRNGEHTEWFPFDKFKDDDGNKVKWSLEHIHAQHTEGLRTVKEQQEWLKLHIKALKSLENQCDLIAEMTMLENNVNLQRMNFEAVQKKVIAVLSESENIEYMHSIGNLALLNTKDNAALNNSTFDVKRNSIMEMDKRGQFIPFCTKMVFLKYYTPSSYNQLHFWGYQDRKAYVEHINEILKNYLEKPIEYEIVGTK